MAEHTQNALRDPRASLLVTEPVPEGADPLASGRVTLLGLLAPVDDDGARDVARARYLEANPAASYYIDFGDFTFLRLTVDHIRYVGGYGRMSWVDVGRLPRRDARSARRRRRRDHRAHERRPRRRAGAVLPPLRRSRRHHVGTMSAVDRYGFDLVAVSAEHRTAVRLAFPRSARPATRCAGRWSRWSPRRGRRTTDRATSSGVDGDADDLGDAQEVE